ncbi:RNA 2',3'-cyclic phosphodiesterase [Polyangium jinanense]|uniref:RNA 2',3'-cyclic phosphodiesterase n=1 Tax=Polyangium jinanense TaxID=2829994 RepID=A0A9X3X5R5_9BACT|nr:RNA 2',3'-cyclic phosphodiesterase [Polyangium jinanense]MDC3954103.1 RNA 2',3'-cyclic phosphodiesterase [Polyangium jinanense]MDC3981941.1 RNA 2',3'-cyclic phosphodiesterase [Polyangium jinanense]
MALGTRRLFLAVDPGDECHTRIAEAVSRARVHAPRARWVRTEGIHVTLVFLGAVEESLVPAVVAKVEGVAVRHAPLTLRFEGAGCFGGRKPRVLWIGVEGDVPALGLVHKELSEALTEVGYVPEERLFSPHLTLARAGFGGTDAGLWAAARALAGESFGEVNVRELVLYESVLSAAGARYEAVARLPLGGVPAPLH